MYTHQIPLKLLQVRFCANKIRMVPMKSYPVLIVLLSGVPTPATRLILRLLTPCKKRNSHHHRGQRHSSVHRWVQIQRLRPLSGMVCKIRWSDRTWQRDLRTGANTADSDHLPQTFFYEEGSMKVNYLKYNTKRIKLLTNFKKRKKITKKYVFLYNILRLYQIRFRLG